MTEQPHKAGGETSAGLVGDVLIGFSRLVQGEIALARAEAERGLRDITKAVAFVVVAAILAITALNVLSGAAIAGLVALGLTPVWATLAVGIGLAVLAYALLQYALTLMKPSNLAPKRSFANLRRDADALKSMVTPHATSNSQV